jgi:hypothetical protein
VHSYATDAFREDILTPFEYLWEFKKENIALGTATYFEFSDPRIQALPKYKIEFEEKFGTIHIVNHPRPADVLHYMLTNPDMFPGNVHIWLNSVTKSGECIRNAGIKDTSIFCRDDERNMINLEAESIYFKDRPINGEYSKFNFYSCRYNDGWNLIEDESATIILLTDVNIPQTLVGIPYKGFQAVGRSKVTPNKIYHITNNFGKEGMIDFNTIQTKWLYNADKHIEYYNSHIATCNIDGMLDVGLLKPIVSDFSKFDHNSNAELWHNKLDQIICEEVCKEHYNNIASIRETWESVNYNTEIKYFDLLPISRIRKSQEDINRQVVERIIEFKDNPSEYAFKVATETLSKYRAEFQLLFEAFEILGPEELEKLNYNNIAMKKALINISNTNTEAKLRIMLKDEFELEGRYAFKLIKNKLQILYDRLGLKKPDGSRRTAKATDLNTFGLFECRDCRLLIVKEKSILAIISIKQISHTKLRLSISLSIY